MTLLDREFAREFIKTYLALASMLAILFFVNIVLDLFDDIFTAGDHKIQWAILHYLYRLPEFIVQTGVICVATSILWVITKKARQNEILAYLAGGISPQRLSIPFLGMAAIICLGTLMTSEFVTLQANRRAIYIEKVYLKEKDPSTLTRNKNIYQRGSQDRFYIIEAFDSTTDTMVEPTIIDVYPETRAPKWILRAESAKRELDASGHNTWKFRHASIREMSTDGKISSFLRKDELFDSELSRPLEPKLEKFLSNLDSPSEMTFLELYEYIRLLDLQGKDTSKYTVELHTKITLPLAIVVIALVICAHVMHPRSIGVVFGFGGGLAWMASYYVVFMLCQKLSEAHLGIPPLATTWLPNVAFGGYGIYSLLKGTR